MLKSYWDDFPSRSMLGWRLPLQRHGGFMTDVGFQNVRSHFDQAFKDTMSCWDNKEVDDFTSYRKLRDRQLTGKDRPSSVLEEGNNYKVVMDVHGFIDNDLKVTFLNEKELIVEGLIEKKSQGSFTRQSFKRRFSFPGNVIVNSAYSTLSSDNILTITVTKQAQKTIQEEDLSSTEQTKSSTFLKTENETKKTDFGQSLESKLGSLMEFPITKRNDFFADSFFDNDRTLFKSRVSEIMNRKIMRDSFGDFTSFRNLRDNDEQNVAVTVTGDSKEHKIVLDVNGFNEGDLKVRAVSDHELLVEGSVEKKTESSFCNNSFRRSFCLPNNTNLQMASSNLSSDGVLTIVIPKMEEKPLPIAYNIPVTIEKKQKETIKNTEETQIPIVIPLGYEDTSSAETTQSHPVTPHATSTLLATGSPPKVETMFQNIQTTEESKINVSTCNKEPVSTNERLIPVLMERTPASDQVTQSIKQTTEKTNNETKHETTSQNIQMKESVSENISKADTRTSTSSSIAEQTSRLDSPSVTQPVELSSSCSVPISMRGDFYNDTVFDAARQQVDSAVRNAMNRSLSQKGHQMHAHDAGKDKIDDTTGTSIVLDEIHSYKIILDVMGFLEKDIQISFFGETELSVEGTMEEKKGNSITQHSFERTFHLPKNINLGETSSVLSSDGMLTITVPKKVANNEEILTAVSKTMTTESIEAQLSNLAQQTKQNNSILDGTPQPGSQKEHTVPLTFNDSPVRTSIMTDAEETRSVASEKSESGNVQLDRNISSATETKNLQKDNFTKDMSVKTCYDLPIMNRGNFFQDAFFDDSKDVFESALRNAMTRFKSFSSFSDDLDFYKNLREEKFSGENLATGISDDEEYKKVVVDIRGYPPEGITVKVIEGNGILVKGTMTEKLATGYSTKCFKRTFFFPEEYSLKDAISALSVDNILNIKIPRLKPLSSLTN